MNKRSFTFFFGFLALFDIIVLSMGWPLRWVTKPLLMVSLIIYFYTQTTSCPRNGVYIIFLVSLILALLGDIFLLNTELFKWGLLSFMGMQIGYSICFLSGRNFFGVRELIIGCIIALVALACVLFLWPQAGNNRIPVSIYAFFIGLMALLAYSRDIRYPGYRAVFTGALLFMISDMILSINQFADGISIHGGVVMISYILAQYYIVDGWISFTCKD